jgi:hypothetical protein
LLRFGTDEAPPNPLPESTICPPSSWPTGANGWQIIATSGMRDSAGTGGVAYVMDGATIIAAIMVFGATVPNESQLRQLASSETMRETYELAVADGMTNDPSLHHGDSTPSASAVADPTTSSHS